MLEFEDLDFAGFRAGGEGDLREFLERGLDGVGSCGQGDPAVGDGFLVLVGGIIESEGCLLFCLFLEFDEVRLSGWVGRDDKRPAY